MDSFKAFVGIASSSIAVILDAVNNLSDVLSSVITIVGTKLALKAPNKKHPLGYGRIEYLAALIVASIVLYAGLTSLTESIKKIIRPQTPDYSKTSLIIIASAVLVKLILGRYVKARGKKASSAALVASGEDASFDAILSASVLASAIIFILTGFSLESYVGVVISLFIIKSGLEMIFETLNDILGKRTDSQLAKDIKATVCEDADVLGAYDLYLFNFGPEKDFATIHVEVARMYRAVKEAVLAKDYALQLHGFYADLQSKTITFDLVLSFDCDRNQAVDEACALVKKLYPDFTICVQPDVDISE